MKRVHVAICDDEELQVMIMKTLLEESGNDYGAIFDMASYVSGEALLEAVKETPFKYEIIFLDIQMGEMNGLETAKKIRRLNQKVIIIFVTADREMVFQSFEVKPFRYLVKPLEKTAFFVFMDALMHEMKWFRDEATLSEENRYIEVVVDKKEMVLNYMDIYYFEKYRNRIIIHFENEQLVFYSSFVQLSQVLDPKTFVQVHQGYLVNLNKVKKISGLQLFLKNGAIINMSRRKCKEVRELFFEKVRMS